MGKKKMSSKFYELFEISENIQEMIAESEYILQESHDVAVE